MCSIFLDTRYTNDSIENDEINKAIQSNTSDKLTIVAAEKYAGSTAISRTIAIKKDDVL